MAFKSPKTFCRPIKNLITLFVDKNTRLKVTKKYRRDNYCHDSILIVVYQYRLIATERPTSYSIFELIRYTILALVKNINIDYTLTISP